MKKVNKKIVLFLLLLAGSQAFPQSYAYKVKYGMVPAGSAELVHTVENGILRSYLSIESSPWLSNLWTLSDSIISIYRLESGKLLKHTKAIHEGSYHRNYDVNFNDSDTIQVNGKDQVLENQDIMDIPSLLYDLSLTKFSNGDTLNYHIWDGRSHGELSLLVELIGKPSILKPFSESGWRLTPLSSSRKSRENNIKLTMLYSISYPHSPLRIEIDTKYGNVIMRLDDS
ncbi:MAG: DUF3108 domain-containing protein [Candidatus Marinimicrobia bacterium]|nr:DUF3108 domain-containing protein [Candidatus Neomarinimicrobiota bacterium]